MMDKSRLILLWGEYSDSTKKQVLDDIECIDKTAVADASKLHRDLLKTDQKKQIRSVLEAMNATHNSAFSIWRILE